MPVRRLLVLLLLIVGLLALPVPAGAGARTDAAFVRATNHSRTTYANGQPTGLRRMAASPTLSKLARRQSVQMARKSARWFDGECVPRALDHNNISAVSHNWVWVGQNVGCGSVGGRGIGAAVRDIQEAFMASKHHRDNIRYRGANLFGVGTYVTDGVIWVTVNFMQRRLT